MNHDVSVPCASRTITGYQSLPESTTPVPGIIVIHEIFGLTPQVRGVVDRFAQAGYAAIAIDLFSGRNKASCMMQAIYGLMIRPLSNGVVKDLQSTIDFFAKDPAVEESKIGVIGFCMGGGYALQLACVDERLTVSAVFYGTAPRPMEAIQKACPIVGSFPEKDFSAKDARRLDAALEKYEIRHEIKIYPGAKHSFFNEAREATYNKEAAEDAWERTMTFFASEFGGAQGDTPSPSQLSPSTPGAS